MRSAAVAFPAPGHDAFQAPSAAIHPDASATLAHEASLDAKECRVGRALLGWSAETLASESGTHVAAVYLLERLGSAGPDDDASIAATLRRALGNAATESDASSAMSVRHCHLMMAP